MRLTPPPHAVCTPFHYSGSDLKYSSFQRAACHLSRSGQTRHAEHDGGQLKNARRPGTRPRRHFQPRSPEPYLSRGQERRDGAPGHPPTVRGGEAGSCAPIIRRRRRTNCPAAAPCRLVSAPWETVAARHGGSGAVRPSAPRAVLHQVRARPGRRMREWECREALGGVANWLEGVASAGGAANGLGVAGLFPPRR